MCIINTNLTHKNIKINAYSGQKKFGACGRWALIRENTVTKQIFTLE